MQEKLEGTNAASWAEGRHALIRWYQAHQRALPWRESPHPYAVWLCEIIMQQTRIDQGLKYWNTFMNTWTDVHALVTFTARLRPSHLSAEAYFQRPPKRGKQSPVWDPTRLPPLHPFPSTSP